MLYIPNARGRYDFLFDENGYPVIAYEELKNEVRYGYTHHSLTEENKKEFEKICTKHTIIGYGKKWVFQENLFKILCKRDNLNENFKRKMN